MRLNNNIKKSIHLQIPFEISKVIKQYKQQANVSKMPPDQQIIERTHDILVAVDFMIVINKMQQTIYESVETEPLKHISENIQKKNRHRFSSCGFCTNCITEDCGRCKNCKDKPKYGGKGIRKRGCIYKNCLISKLN
tara:strand:- start:1038 stop:1448 length:411 start_codon:yes stop_codon:yes gene_type:complete